jgi:hypothetical protein
VSMHAGVATAPPRLAAEVPAGQLSRQIVGSRATRRDELNGYIFWGLVTLFIGVPEILAAVSDTVKAKIPWPTISNLVGKDLEGHHHWIALIVVAVIVVVIMHTLSHPADEKKAGRALRADAESKDVRTLRWGRPYIAAVALAGAIAGIVASAVGADKNQTGYAIYVTLAVLGIVVPSALAYWANKVLDIPTLFATLAYLRKRTGGPWIAMTVVTLLAVLCFHLALYPWPNYHFGTP